MAGRVTDRQTSADEVVRPDRLGVQQRDRHAADARRLRRTPATTKCRRTSTGSASRTAPTRRRTMVEIGSGIGRMTCAFTRAFGTVYACDLDAGFLERCREAVATFGVVDRLAHDRGARRPHVVDRADDVADLVFSYITLQHCDRDDALALIEESVRVARPGGDVALNFRSRSWADVLLLPLGAIVRSGFSVPRFGDVAVASAAGARGWPGRRTVSTRIRCCSRSQAGSATWRSGATRRSHADLGRRRRRAALPQRRRPPHWWLVATVR